MWLWLGAGAVFEPGELFEEGEGDVADGAVALLGDDEGGFAFGFLFLLVAVGVVFLADEEGDDIGVLLDAAGLAEIAEAGAAFAFAGAVFRVTIELGEDDDGDGEFFCQSFDAGRDFGDFQLAIVLRAAGAGCRAGS